MKYFTTTSQRLFLCLLLLFTVLAGVSLYLPQGDMAVAMELPAPRLQLALVNALVAFLLYGALGLLGMRLARQIGFPELWASGISKRKLLQLPLIWGVVLGVGFILTDAFLANMHGLGPLPHPPFPTSLVASLSAGIGEEILFRLFLLSLGLWLWCRLSRKPGYSELGFWTVATLAGLLFALGHLPALIIMLDMDSPAALPSALWAEILLLNGSLSLVAAWLFRYYGILAAMAIHFWTDVVWHVLYGAVS